MIKGKLSTIEKGMIISITILLLFTILRWKHIAQRAKEGMDYLKPVDSVLQQYKKDYRN
ncbi:MAG: hypothetical protein ACRC3G_06955 [Bacteroidales bacterium]